jgi:hypothetical protein
MLPIPGRGIGWMHRSMSGRCYEAEGPVRHRIRIGLAGASAWYDGVSLASRALARGPRSADQLGSALREQRLRGLPADDLGIFGTTSRLGGDPLSAVATEDDGG